MTTTTTTTVIPVSTALTTGSITPSVITASVTPSATITTTLTPSTTTTTTVSTNPVSNTNRFIYLVDTIYSANKKHYHIGKSAWAVDTSECIYNGWTLNTHFNLPMIRYNFTPQMPNVSNLSVFNSSGFGLAINYGRIDISDPDSKSLEHDNPMNQNVEFKNYLGLSLGCLFAVSSSSSSTTVFAPTINLQLLDLQVGLGYELGDVANTAHRFCMTFSYSIALGKLTDVGSWIISNPVPYSNTNDDFRGMY